MPVVSGPDAGCWLAGQAFRFFKSDDQTGPSIDVALRDKSNGADIPPPWFVFITTFLLCLIFMAPQSAVILGLAITSIIAWLFPKIHAEYIAAVFVHDIGLKRFRNIFSRWAIDTMFLKAMRIERWPLSPRPVLRDFKAFTTWVLRDLRKWFWRLLRPWLMYIGVILWGLLKEHKNYFKPVSKKGTHYV